MSHLIVGSKKVVEKPSILVFHIRRSGCYVEQCVFLTGLCIVHSYDRLQSHCLSILFLLLLEILYSNKAATGT